MLVERYGFLGGVAAAVVENKTGRAAMCADVYIDCTGDADLIRRAGRVSLPSR